MARIEWVKQRLDNWALWKDREVAGCLGYPNQVAFMNTSSSGGYREAIIPVDNIDASLTDEAVRSLQVDRPHLHATIVQIYLLDSGIKGAARVLGKAESTIKAQLDQADHALSQWFGERAARKK
jgi:hypothetical protein